MAFGCVGDERAVGVDGAEASGEAGRVPAVAAAALDLGQDQQGEGSLGVRLQDRRGGRPRVVVQPQPPEGFGQPQPEADQVAFHLRHAGDPAAAEWLLRAGEAAQARHAPNDAIDRFTSALAIPDGLGPDSRLRAHRARGRARETTGRFDSAHADYDAARTLAATLADAPSEWQSLLDLGMLWAARDYARTHDYAFLNIALNIVSSFPYVAAINRSNLADAFNVLHLLSDDWGVVREYSAFEQVNFLRRFGYDAVNQRGIYGLNSLSGSTAPLLPRLVESARWRLQLSARYAF